MRKKIPGAVALGLDQLAVGNTSHKDYLMAGLSGNPAGASYVVSVPYFLRR
jgi:hypothetical protein